MEIDLNNYDLEHITTGHRRRSGVAESTTVLALVLQPEHIATLLRAPDRRYQVNANHLVDSVLLRRLSIRTSTSFAVRRVSAKGSHFEASGLAARQSTDLLPEAALGDCLHLWRMAWFLWNLDRLRRRIEREPDRVAYVDEALERDRHILRLAAVTQDPTAKPVSLEPIVIPLEMSRRAT
jgi:hypothetical protein